MAGPIRISILANAIQARREMRRTADEGSRMGRALERVGKVGTAVRERLAGLAKGLLTVVGVAAQVASTAAALAPVLAKAGGAVLKVGKAFGNAAPALAAFAAAAVFIKLTMVAIGPAVVKSLSPITESFTKAGEAAGKLAAKGVKPLAAEFAKVGMPVIASQMNRIAVATNGVVKGFLNWAKSRAGTAALANLTVSTADAFEKLAPHVQRLAIGLGQMIGRISGVSLAAGSSGLTKVLDKVSEKLRGITAESVQKGFDDLKATFTAIKTTAVAVSGVITKLVGIYQRFETVIRAAADAAAVFAIALAFAGGPVGIAIFAAVGLLIRHFDQIKAAITSVKAAFTSPTGTTFMDRLKAVAGPLRDALVGAFEQIKAAVLPTLVEIRDKIVNDLVPAFLDFVIAVTPVVTFFVKVLTPIVVNSIRTIVTVIKGALDIIIGIVKVFTGILTGDWSKTWEGIKQIVSGAWTIVKGLVVGAFNAMKAVFSAGKATLGAIWRGLWALVKDAASSARATLNSIVAGILASIRDKFNQIKTAVTDKMRQAKQAVVDAVNGIKGAVSNIDLAAAGRKIIQTLINGIKSMIPNVGGVMSGIAGKIGGFLPGSPVKQGPLKAWNRGKAGQKLIDLLRDGIQHRSRALAASTSAAAGIVAGGFTPIALGAGTGVRRAAGVQVTFTGVVGDPVEVGRQIQKVLTKYNSTQGRVA